MDAHLFRRFCDELVPRLMGARMEKIHAPGPNVYVFALFGGHSRDGKRFLVLKADRRSPLLFVADHRIPVNAQPPAFVMRLRKHLSDQRITHAVCLWTERRLWLGFSNAAWLCLDLREGPSLSFDAPELADDPVWPSDFPALSAENWREWDVLTPALRRTLPHLDPMDAAALLADLEFGGGAVFLYEGASADGTPRCEVSAWPLPPERLSALGGTWTETPFDDPLPALAKAGETLVYEGLAAQARQNAARPFSSEAARLGKLLKKLDSEQERLSAMRAKQDEALLLQSQLWRFGREDKLESVTLEGPNGDVAVKLDPRRTVRDDGYVPSGRTRPPRARTSRSAPRRRARRKGTRRSRHASQSCGHERRRQRAGSARRPSA